jgi:hypothetical protein
MDDSRMFWWFCEVLTKTVVLWLLSIASRELLMRWQVRRGDYRPGN